MTDKIYNHLECEQTIYSDNYAKHVSAMTGEQLHSKMDIAAELAYRDNEIDRLKEALFDYANTIDTLVDSGHISSHPQVELDALTDGMRTIAQK